MAAWGRRQQARARTRIENYRHGGSILQWRGSFGWLQPDDAIEHPEAWKHNWRVFVHAKDIAGGGNPYAGARATFFPYSDGDGLGAEEVWLEGHSGGSGAKGGGGYGNAPWHSGKRSWSAAGGKGAKAGVQRRIEKLPIGAPLHNKGSAKGKGKGKQRSQVVAKKSEEEKPVPVGRPAAGPGGAAAPERRKETHVGQAGVLNWASSEMRGWRPAMEDAVCVVLGQNEPLEHLALFGVFDGHGGAKVSRRVADDLPAELLVAAQADNHDASATCDAEDGGLAGRALSSALLALDDALRAHGDGQVGYLPGAGGGAPIPSDVRNAYALMGCTAIVALVECDGSPEVAAPLRVTVANLGDSRAIVCRGGEAVALSEDHKPEDPKETARIEKAGGFVAAVGPCVRVDGWGLNLSRALGDFHYKARDDLPPGEQKVSSVADIRTLEFTEEDEFLLLACDGVFELHDNQQAIDHVRKKLAQGASLTEAVEGLVDASCSDDLFATKGKGSDNVSVMVVMLR